MPRNTIPVVATTAPNIRSNIRAIIRLMIGERDRWNELPQPLERHDLAMDMREKEGHILDALKYCSQKNIPPSKETIITLLELGRRMEVESVREYVDALIEENKDDTQGIRTLASFVGIWLQEQTLAAALAKASQIASDPYMDYPEKWEATNMLIMKANPNEGFAVEEMSESDFANLAYRENQRVIELRKSGSDIGPNFPFEAIKAYVPSFQWGEVTLITGPKGSGKTTIGGVLGENVSWSQKLKTDTIHIALETPLVVMSYRQFCRYNLIPYKDIEEGIIDLSSGKWKQKWDGWISAKSQKSNDSGYIRYSYAPGATVFDVIALMTRASETSLALGRRVIFIIDHLHSINWSATHLELGEYGARREIFELLAAHANKLSNRNPNHLFVFAQEGEEKGQTFGGKFQSRRAQYVFSLAREGFGMEGKEPARAPESLMITVPSSKVTKAMIDAGRFEISKKDPKEAIALDETGKPRYWYRKGDKQSHLGSMQLIWANDNATGIINLMFESALARVVGDNSQVEDMRKEGMLPPVGVNK